MVKKRVISVAAAIAVFFSVSVSVRSQPETDAPQDVESYSISELTKLGLLHGYPDGSMQPEKNITRAETAVIFAKAKTDVLAADAAAAAFTDVSGHWSERFINRCGALKLIFGYPDGSFMPENDVTNAEFAAHCLRMAGYTKGSLEESFILAQTLGITEGLELNPNDQAKRGDAAVMLLAALKLPIGSTDETGAFTAITPEITYFTILDTYYNYNNTKKLTSSVLCGYYEDGLINAAPVGNDAAIYIWDAHLGGYLLDAGISIEEAALYNYVAVYDANGDGRGDTLYIVKREDSTLRWNADKTFLPSYGDKEAFSREYSIPYGERLLETASRGMLGGAASDFLNILSPGDISSSTYWPNYDYYNSQSGGSLTLLSGFKTTQQTTGWACGVTCATMALDWYGLRGDLNELDLSALRNTKEAFGSYRFGSYTDTKMLMNIFDALNNEALSGSAEPVWTYLSTYDYLNEDGSIKEDYLTTEMILDFLGRGIPILVGWNAFGGHWQIIIGYDTMGTEITSDDVLIMADPYDTTDHLNDGITIQSYQRMYYDWTQGFDRNFSAAKGYGLPVVFIPIPAAYKNELAPTPNGTGLKPRVWDNSKASQFTDKALIPYGATAADLEASEYAYAKSQRGENGMAGPASSDWYRKADFVNSPYYPGYDFYSGENLSETLILLKNYKTTQQASEWTCGPAAALTVLNWFGKLGSESEFSLAHLRENDREGATKLSGMIDIFKAHGKKYGLDWNIVSTGDLDDELSYNGYYLDGDAEDGLIPYFISQGIPVLIGWDEWGGHWQVIIGYDDMGTPGTQDDVIILADPYDTTDHNQDGYLVESYERLIYGWGAKFDPNGHNVFLAVSIGK